MIRKIDWGWVFIVAYCLIAGAVCVALFLGANP